MHRQWYYDVDYTCCLYENITTNKIVDHYCTPLNFCQKPVNPNIKLLNPIPVGPYCTFCDKLAEGIKRGRFPRYYYPDFYM